MEEQSRREKLKKVMKGKPCAQKEIFYKGGRKTMRVYDIPLDCLIFNKHNGRIATFVKTHEKEHDPIDAESPEGGRLLDQFLWDSRKDRNRITKRDLKSKGQLEYGIVTADGVVIDGNRRFMLLRRIAAEAGDAINYFKAVILEDTLDTNPREIMRLETTYQMGVDDKVDYNPIQKYLKCRDLENEGFRHSKIAEMMGEKNERDIQKYLSTLELMDKYLEEYEYEGMYRILEIEKLEGHFVDLDGYLSKYQKKGKIQGMLWEPNPEDIDDLRAVYFDYMRAGFGVHDIREIANPAKGQGLFTQKDLWGSFAPKHFETMDGIEEEQALQKMREARPDTDAVDLISARDAKFRDQVSSTLENHLNSAKRELEDKNNEDKPFELLKRALKTLEKVNPDASAFGTPDVRDVAKKIWTKAHQFMEAADQKIKAPDD